MDLGSISTPPEGIALRGHTNLAAAIAEALVDALPHEVQHVVQLGEDYPVYSISPQAVAPLADLLQEIVAYTVALLINAGSERDAVMENDDLRLALERELNGWVIWRKEEE